MNTEPTDYAPERYLDTARRIPNFPAWIIARLDFAKAQSSIGVLDRHGAGVTVDQFDVTTSFLDFLKTQVDLEPRGPEHAAAQAREIAVLAALVGTRLARVMVGEADCSGRLSTAVCYLTVDSAAPVYWEYDA